ncbi:MAG: formylglycine-generating enzyme family protein, partial [Spirochaetales bacterium]|nr:formylglycine-generating enzyme family protein [Spirochaetales bacterium]
MNILKNIFKTEKLSFTVCRESAKTVSIDLDGKITKQKTVEFDVLRQELPGDMHIDMVIVPAGSFLMGSLHSKGYKDEQPQHYVHIDRFMVARTGITQQQWKAVMGKLPPCRSRGEEFPVDRVSWFDAQRFCSRLARLTGLPYRLPSEAEREYACRGGTTSDFCYGNMITTDFCNYVGAHTYAGGPEGVYRHGPVMPGQFPPNAFGLHDMHG